MFNFRLTDADRDEFIRGIVNDLGVSEPTAAIMATLFFRIVSAMPQDQAGPEFQRVVVQAAEKGESWAAELVTKMFARQTGRPYLADIACPDGVVRVVIDPAATVASATIRTADTTGPAADAARRATVRLHGDVLTVNVPPVFRQGTTVYQNVSYVGPGVTVTGMTIDGNGNMAPGGTAGPSPIEVTVTLPPGSGVRMRSATAPLSIHGAVAALDFETRTGGLTADVLGRVKVHSSTGDIAVSAVQEWADLETRTGSVEIGSYAGGDAKLVTSTGDIRLTASRGASGRISARTRTGDIWLRGVAGRRDLDVAATTGTGDIRKD
ncbi:hypothetical protein AQ490_06490 [Wenjunlia vitaminophila]|uniref:DUF4097 domain-containing protein n=1 Tax=Wenjunlia vitaminophila TaxID=76728 RepID=A0A0T6LNJ3_WENVI|nr:DUF4097 family beta strand repeat-containing protein [Wenjunlia vitaminophila]KRV47540.1 hypothetical protein AQ490_06490 [Wenjunlia vitaminophila]